MLVSWDRGIEGKGLMGNVLANSLNKDSASFHVEAVVSLMLRNSSLN